MLIKYNGVLLPSYPTDVDPAEYPYKFIRSTSDKYNLLFSKTPFFFVHSSDGIGSDSNSRYYSIGKNQLLSDSSEWAYVQTVSAYPNDYYSLGSNSVQWSNSDILYRDSTQVYFAGLGEPVIPTHDYNSIEDIVASAENATQLVTNTKYDDNSYIISGLPEFVKYKGASVSTIYANGNSWIGFDAESEHFKYNRRDAAMYDLWKEEGTFLGIYRFFRIRWHGMCKCNAAGEPYRQTFDLVIFETGDVMFYAVNIPTQYYDGINSFADVDFTAPTTDSRYVSFYAQADGKYRTEYAPISFVSPYLTKYLIRDSGKLYTVTDGALTEITGTLNAELFQTSGINNVPDGALLIGLTAPEVLCWTNGTEAPTLTATVQGNPVGEHDIISDKANVGHSSIYGITSVEAVASEGVTFLLSFDGGAWMSYNNGKWSASDVGMTTAELVAVPANAWSSVINSAKYMQLKATLDGIDTVTKVKFNFDNNSES